MQHPRDVLLGAQAAALVLPVCDHYSGVDVRMRKSLQLQAEMTEEFGACVFDATLDCEDGAPVGGEAEHAALVVELARTRSLNDVAVLFRAGYQSFSLEVELNRIGLPFRKWGGIKFYEAAHIKDVLAYLRVVGNPQDLVSWLRLLDQIRGLGPKTARKIVDAVLNGDEASLNKAWKKFPELAELFGLLTRLRSERPAPAEALRDALAHYDPVFKERYADDYPMREAGLEELSRLAAGYQDLGAFLADVTLESPDTEEEGGQAVTLSTVHSAKGLEWSAVIIIDLAEERFPSKRSAMNPDDLEEERRLLYVACTRAKDEIGRAHV